jgi:hypothetical protein
MDMYDRTSLIKLALDGYPKSPHLDIDEEAFEKDVRTFFVTRKMVKRFLSVRSAQ